MESFRYVIVGGGIAGTTAAETIRVNDPEGRIAVVSDEPYPLYSRVMLSKPGFFLGRVPFDQIWMRKEPWYAEKKIVFLGGRKAVALDVKDKTLKLDDGTGLKYEKLLLANGTRARRWNVPGADKKNIHYVRTLDDGKGMIQAVKFAKRAVVIGAAFIGMEMCDMLKLAGLDVTLVIREPHFWDPLLDEASGRIIEAAMEKHGVKIVHKSLVKEVVGGESVEGVVLEDGRKIDCDMIVVGIGAFSDVDWVKAAGLEVNRGIVADEYLETGAPDVWTAGDVAEFRDVCLDERQQCGSWINAQMQGRTAGLNMTGKKQVFRLVSFYTATGFGVNIGFVGDVYPLPGREVISRLWPDGGKAVRFIVKGAKLYGATMINRNEDVNLVAKLIDKNVDAAALKDKLADPSVDLKTLIPT